MAKKNNPLTCPYCLTKLLEVTGHCVGVIVKCNHCGASVLADVDETGKMRLSADPNKARKCRKRLPCAKRLYEKPYGTADGSKNYGQADMKI